MYAAPSGSTTPIVYVKRVEIAGGLQQRDVAAG